jgi:hypothetical protein
MKQAITEFQPSKFLCSVRFVQGYRFLDRCGEAIIRLEDELDEGWVPGETKPTGGRLHNFTLGMVATFDSASLNVVQEEFLSFDHFLDQTGRIYDVLRGTFDVKRILTPTSKVIHQVGFANGESAEDALRTLSLCTTDRQMLSELGGTEEAKSFTICTRKEVPWQESQASRRTRLDARVIRQERQPRFDERLLQRLALLPERHHVAMRDLRRVRRQHSQIVDFAVQFDAEYSFEGEFSSRSFDLRRFLADTRDWAEHLAQFIRSRGS